MTHPSPRYEVLAQTALEDFRSRFSEWEYLEIGLWMQGLGAHPRRSPSRHVKNSPDGHEIRSVVLSHPPVAFTYVILESGLFADEPAVLVMKPIRKLY